MPVWLSIRDGVVPRRLMLRDAPYAKLVFMQFMRANSMLFNDVIESIKSLSLEEKWEIQLLLHHYIREDNREEILKNFQSAKVEQERGELVFSADIAELKNLIEQ